VFRSFLGRAYHLCFSYASTVELPAA